MRSSVSIVRAFATVVICAIASPQAAFAQEDMSPPKIVHQIVTKATAGAPLEIQARFYDQSGIFEPKVYYRRTGTSNYKTASMTKSGEFYLATIPGAAVTGGLQYFIEAFDENGNGPARHGSPDAPHPVQLGQATGTSAVAPPAGDVPRTIIITPPAAGGAGADPIVQPPPPPIEDSSAGSCNGPGAPVYCEWWFWTLVMVPVLVGGGLGIYFGVRGEDTPYVDALIDLNVSAPDPRP